ncbi:MAG: glycosyltransferase family 2 protein [Paludibacteraceae bacterium]|nr:glycosyltransferase family 2 protein [Paludibacteraceae bacterium]
MDFTVVIPSRNRPELLRDALSSVLAQSHPSLEIIVVNDGSDGEFEQAYAALATEFENRVRFLNLEHTSNGHGSSYAINRGVDIAQSEFVCFLDDDDYWIDSIHLERARQALNAEGVDAYYTNQEAYRGDHRVNGAIWLEGLDAIIERRSGKDADGFYTATVVDLMACKGFGHLNTSVVRRSLYLSIGGMDENIRYENDWDFYLRTIDSANCIRFYPGITSHHNAPDPTKKLNLSTAVSLLQKLLFRSYVLDKAILFAKSPAIRESARTNKIQTLKKMAELLACEGKYRQAYTYAREAGIRFADIKWHIFSAYLFFKGLLTNQ